LAREQKRKAEDAQRQEQEAAAALTREQVAREQREREQAAKDKDQREHEKMQNELREKRRLAAEEKEAELFALAAKAAQADPLLDSRIVPYFRNHNCLSRFRELVTDPNDRHWFPITEQLALVKRMCEQFEKDNRGRSALEHLSANYVGSYIRGFLEQNQRAAREDERRARTLGESFKVELANAIRGAATVFGAVAKMMDLLDKGASPPDDFEEKLRSLEMHATDEIERLRAKSGYVRGAKEIPGQVTLLRSAISRQ